MRSGDPTKIIHSIIRQAFPEAISVDAKNQRKDKVPRTHIGHLIPVKDPRVCIISAFVELYYMHEGDYVDTAVP